MYKKDFIITDITNIIFVDKDEYPEDVTSFYAPLHSNELIYDLTGEHTVYFNDQKLAVFPDSIRFLPKGPYERYDVHRLKRGDCIDIFFHTNVPIADEAFVLNVKAKTYLAELFKKIFSVWVAKNEEYRFECISLLYKIFAEMGKERYISQNQFSKIEPAVDYIHEYFLTEKISNEKLCSLCNISYSYLKQLFIKKFGVTPTRYIIQLKMSYASDMLKTNLYTISQIADSCGFCDIYYFSNQFKKTFGISPKEFQRKYKSTK